MFETYNKFKFILDNSHTDPEEFANLWERFEAFTKYNHIRKYLANPTIRDSRDTDLSWFNILQSKKIDSQDRTITKQQKFEEDLQGLIEDTIVEDLSEEGEVLLQQIREEEKLRLLQLYFDCYMSPKLSDAMWRLGPVTGTVLDTAKTDELGTIVDGEMYTRSNFAVPYVREFLDNNRAADKKEFYTSLFFPPYKMGISPEVESNTFFMNKIREHHEDISFNQDTFRVRKEGFTYRDPGFKAINDNIIWLQWLQEGVTGVISTYLTEWDLSLYMQERMMSPMPNGGPVKLYLNYRIRPDNPMSDKDLTYVTDKALCFNVAGSAVSKIDFDCSKHWRPSDFPLAQYWLPYIEGRDYNLDYFEYYSDRLALDVKVPYMDIYDQLDPDFTYEDKKDIRDILRHNDYYGAIMGNWNSFNMRYFHAFYSTDHEALTNFEIEVMNMMGAVKGAMPGQAAAVGITPDELAFCAKAEMLANGGIHGKPLPAGQSNSQREEIKNAMGTNHNDPGQWVHIMAEVKAGVFSLGIPHSKGSHIGPGLGVSAMIGRERQRRGKDSEKRKRKSSMDAAMDAANTFGPLEQILAEQRGNPGDNETAKAFLNSGLNMKPDASQMGKTTGLNRWSPVIYGGPHGADFSPNSIQGWYQTDSRLTRNIPRISWNNCDWFKSTNYEDEITDLNEFYQKDDEKKKSLTFQAGLKKLVQGLNSYVIDYIQRGDYKTDWVQGHVGWAWNWRRFNHFTFPHRTSQGYIYQYEGEIQFRERTLHWSRHPWTSRSWYYNYYSYHNYHNVYWHGWWGGRWGFNLVTYDAFRKATYYEIGLHPYKRYVYDDMPTTKWQIVHHEFGDTTPPTWGWGWNWGWRHTWGHPHGAWGNYYTSGFWGWQRHNRWHHRVWRRSKHWGWNGHWFQPQEVRKKTAYVLKFYENPEMEQEFIRRMLNNDHSGKSEIPLLFCLGNEDNRFTQGPEALFRVKCKVDYYWTAVRNFRRRWRWWGWRRWRGWGGWRGWWRRSSFQKVYYISVDLASIDFFEDNLQAPLKTNKYYSGHDVPLHLKMIQADYTSAPYTDNILNKFNNNYYDVVTANRWVPWRRRWGWFWGWRGSAFRGWMGGWRSGWRFGWGRNNWGWRWLIDPVWWTSTATKGISGIGILSDVQGIDPEVEDMTIPNMTMSFREFSTLDENSRNIALKNLPFKVHRGQIEYFNNNFGFFNRFINRWGWGSRRQGWGYGWNNGVGWHNGFGWGWGGWQRYGWADNYGWGFHGWNWGWHGGYWRYNQNWGYNNYNFSRGPVSYESEDMDNALKITLIKMYTRALFKPELREDEEPFSFISLDVPFRNFLSTLQTQLPLLEIYKESVVDVLDFEVLHNSLFKCVDRCVLKANGMTYDGEYVGADPDHPLYDYWIDLAVKYFGDKSNFDPIQNELQTLLNNKIQKFKLAITHFRNLCLRDSVLDWTFNEICTCFEMFQDFKTMSERDLLDNFCMAYLHILYNYRFYFIAKRFNKEDGTMWIMRALESILEFVAPFGTTQSQPPPPSRLQSKLAQYRVTFYELQNTTSVKHDAIINDTVLGPDRVNIVYVRVKWVDRKAYEKWLEYDSNPNNFVEVEEVIEIEKDGIIKYAEKPRDGVYQFFSREWLENDRNIKWNELHPNEQQRYIHDFDTSIWHIDWGDNPKLTPIRWNVFGTINVNNLLEYSRESISPEELLCLIEEGADFWTVRIPESLWPRNEGYRTGLRLRQYERPVGRVSLKNDAYVTLLGPMAYSVYPITAKQDSPVPGVTGGVDQAGTYGQFMVGVDNYG